MLRAVTIVGTGAGLLLGAAIARRAPPPWLQSPEVTAYNEALNRPAIMADEATTCNETLTPPAFIADEPTSTPRRPARGDPGPVDEYGDVDPHRKLETMRMSFGLELCKLENVIAYVRDFTGLNVIIDAGVRDVVDVERLFPFYAEGLLKEALSYLCAIVGLEFVVTEENVVFITLPAGRAPDTPRDVVARILDEAIR
jgi:hypothetical protein